MRYDAKWDYSVECANEDACSGYTEESRHLDDIFVYTENLGDNVPFVRVDFCDCEERAFSGELTFTLTGCLSETLNSGEDEYCGSISGRPSKRSRSSCEITNDF